MPTPEFENDVAGPKGHTMSFDLATIGVLVDIGLVSHASTMVRKIRTRKFVAGESEYTVNAPADVDPVLVKRIEGKVGEVTGEEDPDGFTNRVIGPKGRTSDLPLSTIITLIQLGLVHHVRTTVWPLFEKTRLFNFEDRDFKSLIIGDGPDEWKRPVA